jgi:hypothetical protein
MTDVMAAIACDANTRPTCFSPNAFSVDGHRVKVPKKRKLAKLIDVIQNYEITKDTEVLYMYYDVENGVPKITTDCADPAVMKMLVGQPIIS